MMRMVAFSSPQKEIHVLGFLFMLQNLSQKMDQCDKVQMCVQFMGHVTCLSGKDM